MQVLVEGTEFLLDTSDKSTDAKPVHIKFCHKDVEGRFINGHTTEEFLDMLISRALFMVNKEDSSENIRLLSHLRQAKAACEVRNNRKLRKRNVDPANGARVQGGS